MRDKAKQKVSRSRCYYRKRDIELQRNKEWRMNNKERRARANRNNRLLRDYGITLAQYEHMRTRQDNECAICGDKMMGINNCHVDHDHRTNMVRGLLCNRCNGMLGMAREDPIVLILATDYLTKWKIITERR